MKISSRKPPEHIYSIIDGVLLVDGTPFDMEKVIEIAKQTIKHDLDRLESLEKRHGLYKKIQYGSMEKGDVRSAPGITNIERLKSTFLKLNEDLYLRAQLGMVALSFEDNLRLLSEMGHPIVTLSREKAGALAPTDRVYLTKSSIYSGTTERVLGDSKVLPNFPSMPILKKAFALASSRTSQEIRDFERSNVIGQAQISIDIANKSCTLTIKVVDAANPGLSAPEQLDLVTDVEFEPLLHECNRQHEKLLELNHQEAMQQDITSKGPIARKINHKVFSGPI